MLSGCRQSVRPWSSFRSCGHSSEILAKDPRLSAFLDAGCAAPHPRRLLPCAPTYSLDATLRVPSHRLCR
jgi:hypothetical protein